MLRITLLLSSFIILLSERALATDYKYTIYIDEITISDKFIHLSWKYDITGGSPGDKPDYYSVVTKQSNYMKLESLPSEPNINLTLDSAKQYEITIEAKENGVSNQISNKHTETLYTKMTTVDKNSLHAFDICDEKFISWTYLTGNEADSIEFSITCRNNVQLHNISTMLYNVTDIYNDINNGACSIQVNGKIGDKTISSEETQFDAIFVSLGCPALEETKRELQNTIIELQNTTEMLVQVHAELEANQMNLNQTYIELNRTYDEVRQLSSELDEAQTHLSSATAELEEANNQLDLAQSDVKNWKDSTIGVSTALGLCVAVTGGLIIYAIKLKQKVVY